jgi:tetratricopeptide (TPR) repeat protein
MAIDTSCPPPVRLVRFVRGQAGGADAAALGEHLEHCERCQAAVSALRAEALDEVTIREESGDRAGPAVANGSVSGTFLLDEDDGSSSTLGRDPPSEGERTCQVCSPDLNQVTLATACPPTGEPTAPAPKGAETCNYLPGDEAATLPAASSPAAGVPTPATLPAGEKPAGVPRFEGPVIAGHEILQELGRGGMGIVYKARHVRLNRLVALKMILGGAHAGAAGLARFRAEAEAVAQLQHPNIVQIYEVGEHDGRAYICLEYVDGGSLERRIRQSRTSPRAAAELLETLALTMHAAHQRGIVHRDLKPGNVLLAEHSGQSSLLRREQTASDSLPPDHWSRTTVPKIADFGLAKRVDGDSSQTQSGTVLGTPSYMAPEQAAGKTHEVGPAADTYALGAILYDVLTGRPPFKAGNPIDTIRQVIDQDPVPPRQLEPRVPLDLETICLKCLQKEPASRYATAEDLATDLRRFLDDEPIRARPTPAWERAWKWGKRRPAVVALLALAAAAVVGILLFIVWHNVTLRGQLEQARAEERLARRREQEALEARRLGRAEQEGHKLLDDARIAVAARDWPGARLHLTNALATIGNEERLASLKEPAELLLKQVEAELRLDAERRDSRARRDKFGSLRDEAQFLGTLYTGMDLTANLKATRAAARQALAVYGVSADDDSRPAFDSHLDEQQKAGILDDCYQLVLILAETEAQAAAGRGSAEQEKALRAAASLLAKALRFGAPSRAWHLRQSRYLRLLGDESGARRAEKAAADAAVTHDLDHFLVADELYRRGEFDEAIGEFNQVLRRKPAHFWAEYLSALCLLRQHRAAEARAQLGACLANRPQFVWLYLLRGFAQGELRAFDDAEADFQTALQMPLDDSARYVLFVNRGVLRVREERLDDAVSDLKTAIELKPNEYQAYVNLAQAYRRQKKLDPALEQLNRAVALEPSLAQVYRLRARLSLERKEFAQALKDFDEAILREDADGPPLADDHVERGRLLLHLGKPADALAAFDEALRRRKDHLPAWRLRAEALFDLGRYRESVEAFDRYLDAGKPLESVYRGRGLARAELGQYPGAIEDYTRALELRPTSEVQAYRGWAHLVCEAPKLALRDFELAIELDAKNGDAYNGRAFVLASQGKTREAARDAEEAVRQGPKSPRLLYNAARVHALCGGANEPRAVELIGRAVEMLPGSERPAFWEKYVRADPVLDVLRRYDQFRQLEADVSRR